MVHKVAVIVDPKAFTLPFDQNSVARDAYLSQVRDRATKNGAEVIELRTSAGEISLETKQHTWATALSQPLRAAQAKGDTLSYVIVGSTTRRGVVEATDALQEVLGEDTSGAIKSCSLIAQNALVDRRYHYLKGVDEPIVLTRSDLPRLGVSNDVPRQSQITSSLHRSVSDHESTMRLGDSYDNAVKGLEQQGLISIPKTDEYSEWVYEQDFYNWLGKAITLNQQAA